MAQEKKIKVMVLGFDGATFDILDPLIKKGRLPNFARVRESGAWGRLRSTLPPLSGPAWTTFATGKYPGKHGIYDFFRNRPENYDCTPVNASFLESKTFWEVISEQGMKAGVANMLFTWPPQKVNGFVISGREAPSEEAPYTHPEGLKEEILKFEPGFKAEPFRQISRTKHFLRYAAEQLKRQERANKYLLARYPCDLNVSFFAIPDILQHIFMWCMDPGHPNFRQKDADSFMPLIEECFAALDGIIGGRLEVMDKDTALIIMSDHGAGPVRKVVQINKWLQEEGLLAINDSYGSRRVSSMIFMKDALRSMMNVASRFDVLGLRRVIGFKTREKRMAFARKNLVEWHRTKAYSGRVGEYGIHINLSGREGQGNVSPREYEGVRDDIIRKLSALKDPDTGQNVFERIWRREEAYQGPFVKYAPDLILDFGERPYLPGDSLLARGVLEEVPRAGLGGMHRDHGIVMATGRGIKKGRFEGPNICDLAPTILHLMAARIPDDMDGKVLSAMLAPEIARRPPDYYSTGGSEGGNNVIYSDKEAEEISKRLGDLGYL
ncbi:MAG: alkaline phosphatase family protein [Deltaproteobacteria bacterium]|nr:alkaline phosphatase family protein [Deltaproteobacteria bacterium]